MTTVEHVIIGSGINSLVAAALLSRKGDSVLVLEKEDTLGGCMKTDEITLPGFHHDIMATTFVLFLTSPAFAELGEALGKHGLEFCHTDKPTGVMRPNGSALVMSMDHAANVAEFNARAKGDGDSHSGIVGGIGGDADFLFSILGGRLWSWQMTKLMFGQWRKKGLKGLKSWFGRRLSQRADGLKTILNPLMFKRFSLLGRFTLDLHPSPLIQVRWARSLHSLLKRRAHRL